MDNESTSAIIGRYNLVGESAHYLDQFLRVAGITTYDAPERADEKAVEAFRLLDWDFELGPDGIPKAI